MDCRFNKNLFLILVLSLSSLFLSTNSTRILELSPIGSPTEAPTAEPQMLNSGINFLKSIFASEVTKVAKQIDPEILKLCTSTENPKLCADSISSFLQGPFDPIQALEIEIDETLKQAKSAAATILKSLNDPSTDKNALDALGICKSQYDDMLDTLKEAVELVMQQNVVDAYYKFSSVISYQSSCVDAFTETPGVQMPFEEESVNVYQLGGNCLAIMDAIVNNHKV